MSTKKPKIGSVGWMDLTVPDATKVSAFYAAVTGWKVVSLDMGGYNDYCMNAPGGTTVAGICHARGANADLPPQWLIYVTVKDLTASLRECRKRGGKVVRPATSYGRSRYAIICDPAGAHVSLFEPTRPRKKSSRKAAR